MESSSSGGKQVEVAYPVIFTIPFFLKRESLEIKRGKGNSLSLKKGEKVRGYYFSPSSCKEDLIWVLSLGALLLLASLYTILKAFLFWSVLGILGVLGYYLYLFHGRKEGILGVFLYPLLSVFLCWALGEDSMVFIPGFYLEIGGILLLSALFIKETKCLKLSDGKNSYNLYLLE